MAKCIDCKHSKITDEKAVKKEYECKRYPPTVQMFPAQDNFGRIAIQRITSCPVVEPGDYCGEFEPAPPKISLIN